MSLPTQIEGELEMLANGHRWVHPVHPVLCA